MYGKMYRYIIAYMLSVCQSHDRRRKLLPPSPVGFGGQASSYTIGGANSSSRAPLYQSSCDTSPPLSSHLRSSTSTSFFGFAKVSRECSTICLRKFSVGVSQSIVIAEKASLVCPCTLILM